MPKLKNSRTKKKSVSEYNIELGFISKLIETKDMKFVKDLGITTSFFTGEHKRVFMFIQNTFKTSGEVPTPRVIQQKFPSYELEYHMTEEGDSVGTDETFHYWCDELRTKAKHNKMADIIESVAETMNDSGGTEDAYDLLKQGVWYIENNIVESDTVDVTQDTEERKNLYLERKKNKGMMGIPTGIPHLDYMLKGLVPETLTTIIATTGVGKTWLLVLFACYAQLQGYRVVIFLTEMGTSIMQDRIEAMLFGMICGEFDYNKFKSGSLDEETEEAYFEFLEDELPRLEPLKLETATGISSIVACIENEDPDIIFIDSAYLMSDEQGARDDWAKITHITRDLKQVAKTKKIPIVINPQAEQNTSKKTGPGLGDIKYSQAIGQDSDNIIAMFRDEVMIADGEMGLRLLKQREGVLGKVIINWMFKTMNFRSVYSETEDSFSTEESEEEVESIIGLEE